MATAEPTVSAIVCTFDRPGMIGDCIGSLQRALLASDQIVVVEAGDSAVAAALDARDGGPAAVHLRSDRPGKSRQLNLGVRAAAGDLLLFTDDDVRVDARWRSAMIAAFDDPAVAVACGRVDGLHFGVEPPTPAGPGQQPETAYEAPFETWTYAHGALMAIRAEALADVGGFDERLGPGAAAHGEEHDILLRLRERGWKVTIVPAAPARHLEWRDEEARGRNAIVYERGAGAFVGAALRRAPRTGWPVLTARLRYQVWLVGENPRLGLRGLLAFTGGLLFGLRLRPRTWLSPSDRATP
jgi:GT2 family glycosyltransferase